MRPIWVNLQPRADQQVDIARHPLMLRIGRRRHVVLSVDELVPLPIVWEQQEVVVGELHAGAGRLHAIAPRHAPILTSSVSPTTCQRHDSKTQTMRGTISAPVEREMREGRTWVMETLEDELAPDHRVAVMCTRFVRPFGPRPGGRRTPFC